MALGVYVAGLDPVRVDSVSLAVEQSDDLYVAPTIDGADVVVAPAELLAALAPPENAAVVVLCVDDPVAAARSALAHAAHGIVSWPADEHELGVLLYEAASRRTYGTIAPGRVVSVVSARGGAGASTIVAYLARAFGDRAMIIDASGGPAGQALFAPEEPALTMTDLVGVLDEITPEGIRRALSAHASGAPCLYGGARPVEPTEQLLAAARSVALLTIVDGFAPGADTSIVVLGPDVGSVRAAGGHTDIVLNRTHRSGVSVRAVARALGRRPVATVPRDARVARAADAGRLVKRGAAARALRRLGATLAP